MLMVSPQTGSWGENSQSLMDAAAEEISSKTRTESEVTMKVSLLFLRKLVNLYTGVKSF